MIRLKEFLLAIAAVAVVLPASSLAVDPLANPLHNFVNARDVDASGLVTPRDLLLVFNQLRRQEESRVDPLTAQLESSEQYYWDTNNSGTVSANDGLLIINHLLKTQTVPEPGALVTGGIGLAALAGFCLRRRKRA